MRAERDQLISVICSCNLLDEEAWPASEVVEMRKNGIGGFLGFQGLYDDKHFHERGYT